MLAIAREDLTEGSTLAWAKLVAEWIVGPQEGVGVQRKCWLITGGTAAVMLLELRERAES